MVAVKDRFEVQVASCRPSSAPYPGDGLANSNGVSASDGYGLQVVVGADETVAVVYFHPVAAAPRMPPRGTYNARISRVHLGAARRCVVLAQMEVSGCPGQRTDPEPEGRRGSQHLEGRHEVARGRPAQPGQFYCQR